MKMPQTEPGRDAVLATPGLAAGGFGAVTANDILIYLSILYMLVLLGFTSYRWWVMHTKVRAWERAKRIDPRTPPPTEVRPTKPGDLDD
jgi:hypothetical protein